MYTTSTNTTIHRISRCLRQKSGSNLWHDYFVTYLLTYLRMCIHVHVFMDDWKCSVVRSFSIFPWYLFLCLSFFFINFCLRLCFFLLSSFVYSQVVVLISFIFSFFLQYFFILFSSEQNVLKVKRFNKGLI